MPAKMLTEGEEEMEATPSCDNVLKERRLTWPRAAKLMGLTPPDVSDLLRGRLDGFTLDHLFRGLDALGQEVEIVVRPKRPAADVVLFEAGPAA